MFRHLLIALLALLALESRRAQAQLAITETMSSASTNNTQATTFGQGPDFWELTNFGTNTLDLTGYRFNDADASLAGDADAAVFDGLMIGPGESVVFVQLSDGSGVTNRDDFFTWWGAANLPTNLQVRFYTGNGQSSAADSIVIWDNLATDDADYLDRADFGEAVRGHTFAYNVTNATFGVISSNGVQGVFVAATSDDEGSPGHASGPVSMAFTLQPTNATGYVGFPLTLRAAAYGLPRPRFQWLRDNQTMPGETHAALTITNVQSGDAATYAVLITNGLEVLRSSNAVVTVNTTPTGPTFLTAPNDIDAYLGQTVTLSATAQGNPAPSFQWRSNGVALAGQTSPQLVLPNLQLADTAVYSVAIANLVNTNFAAAKVTVTTKPHLLITEAHSSGSSAPGGQDWWELTNLDGFAVRLKGYRFDDSSQSLGLAVTFTNDLTINPGESVVLVENLTPDQFRSWWGPNNVPPSVKILSYSGSGVGLSGSSDALYLWNAAATANGDFICGVTFNAAIGTAPRQSFVQDPDNPISQSPFSGTFTIAATNGWNGGFAATTGDLGSPGRYIDPLVLTTTPTNPGATLSWNTTSGRNYAVDYRDTLTAATWQVLTNLTASGPTTVIQDPAATSQRYYRARAVLPVP